MTTVATNRETVDMMSFRESLSEQRGGTHAYVTLLGLRTFAAPELLAQIEAGLPYEAFERFRLNLGLTAEELAMLVQIKLRTLARRRAKGRLTPEESDRLLRAARVVGRALALFEGNLSAARAWLSAPALALGSRTPEDVASTDLGAREVENLIGRLEHGIVS